MPLRLNALTEKNFALRDNKINCAVKESAALSKWFLYL